jgi:phosphatidate cytidylyltransferase
MTTSTPVPAQDHGRAGRNLPAAITSAVVLVALIIVTLVVWKTLFMVVVAAAVLVAMWELHRGFAAKDIDLPEQPLMAGGVIMVVVAYFYGAPALVTATAVTALVTMLWLLHRGVSGYVQNASASVFALIYVPFLGSFVALLLREGGAIHFDGIDAGVKGIFTFIAVTAASDIGGYIAGVLFGRHQMAPVISPKKSWEGFAGSVLACVVGGAIAVPYALDGPWWGGAVLGACAAVAATVGDLTESTIKRDLGIKDMSAILPGHGGIMDRLDSLLLVAPVAWALLTVFVPGS